MFVSTTRQLCCEFKMSKLARITNFVGLAVFTYKIISLRGSNIHISWPMVIAILFHRVAVSTQLAGLAVLLFFSQIKLFNLSCKILANSYPWIDLTSRIYCYGRALYRLSSKSQPLKERLVVQENSLLVISLRDVILKEYKIEHRHINYYLNNKKCFLGLELLFLEALR